MGLGKFSAPQFLLLLKYVLHLLQGPELMCCGPYRPISLITYVACIASINPRVFVSRAPALSPSLTVDISLIGLAFRTKYASIALKDSANGQIVKEEKKTLSIYGSGTAEFEVNGIVAWELEGLVELWWPAGYGKQKLYDLEVSLFSQVSCAQFLSFCTTLSLNIFADTKDEEILDVQSKRIGFRRVQLIQETLHEADRHGTGTSFLFEINGIRMFMGGALDFL